MKTISANYYNDGRDVLEAAYPTCMNFAHYHAKPTGEGLARRACGVAMIISLESEPALQRFRRVCYGLESSVPWDRFCFDVYDFTGLADLISILSAFGSIAGLGELFWISEGHITDAMTAEYDPPLFDKLTAKLIKAH